MFPRVHPDPDRYIRMVKGGRYQARPYDFLADHLPPKERRMTIPGTFATKAQARKAIRDFWWGRIEEVAYGTRHHPRRKSSQTYAALIIVKGRVAGVLSWHTTREEAAQAFAQELFRKIAETESLLDNLRKQRQRLPQLECR